MAKVTFLREPHTPVVYEGACLIHHATAKQVEGLLVSIMEKYGDYDQFCRDLDWWANMRIACHE